LWSGAEPGMHRSSEVCLRLLDDGLSALGMDLGAATLFCADLGPGSFTGVRVGIVLAKTLAFTHSCSCAGADSFDLVSPHGTVVLPSKKGEYFVRRPGEAAFRTTDLPEGPFEGYGIPGDLAPTYPEAQRFGLLISRISPVTPERLMPGYLIEPSISVPKKRSGGAA